MFPIVSFPQLVQLEELVSPQMCRPKPRINEEKKYLKSCIFQGASLHMICTSRYKYIKHHKKVSRVLTANSWCTRGNAG